MVDDNQTGRTRRRDAIDGVVVEAASTADGKLPVAVAQAVASFLGRPVTALPPLQDTLDTDALSALAGESGDEASPAVSSVAFTYADCRVTVCPPGTVVVADAG